MRVNTVVYGH